MRKVLFKRWVPKEIVKESSFQRPKEGTNCWEKEFTYEGLFHQWGVNYEGSGDIFINYTVAIIELPDGTIEQVLPSNIKFIN